MKKLTLKNLNAYHRLSTEEKRQVVGGGRIEVCLGCAPGWVKVVDHCQYVECKKCSSLPLNYPGCPRPTEEIPIFTVEPTEPIFPIE